MMSSTENWRSLFWSRGPDGELKPPKDQPWLSNSFAEADEIAAKAAWDAEGLFWDVDAGTARAKRLWELYRLTPEDHTKIFKYQGRVCAISKRPSGRYGTDHCHATGLIRGILDWRINKGLAFFSDDPNLLRAAADYLENPPATAALGAPRYGLIGRAKQGKKNKVYGPAAKLPKRRQ